MAVLVVGATGATGRLLVEQLLDRGQQVRAIVRSPDALPEAVRNHASLSLTQARRLTTSDAGSLYLVEEGEDGEDFLHFLLAHNDTLPELESPTFRLPLDRTSIAGYVASTGEALVIDDVYEIPEDEPYSFNPGFDQQFGYKAAFAEF